MERLLKSKNYSGVCPDTIKKVYERELIKRKNPKEAEQAAKTRLHAITGAYMSADELKKAKKCLERYLTGDENALNEVLMLHSSTRERVNEADALYDRIAAFAAAPKRVLDAACGLNPINLGRRGYKGVLAVDIHAGVLNVVDEFSRALNWDIETRCVDLSITPPADEFDLALVMKLIPVLDTDEKGGGMKLLNALNAKKLVVTFPTRTLGGRSAGMEENYSARFEGELPSGFIIKDRFTLGSELVYFIEK